MDPYATTIPELICWSTTTYADGDAIRDGDMTLTYRQLGIEADRAARALIHSGVAAGDSVAIW
ncbi:MAG: fatty acid--CoA ligase family protein, partial [Actinomycetia bacterium]|nr:fatty acid--CoA ligase family protein [Actinomycetes bacterium]